MADEQYELYQQGTAEALADWQLDNLARQDGYYAQMTVGAADNLTGRGDAVPATYLHRTAGGTASIESGQATVESIHGRSLRWNQLARNTSTSPVAGKGVTFTPSLDGTITLSGTATSSGNAYPIKVSNVQGHKYLIHGHASSYTDLTFSSQSYGFDSGSGNIITNNSANASWYYTITVKSDIDYEGVTLRPQVFDLTQMFGAGNEPSTVAEFEALYPLPYYPYDAGSLLPVRMTGVETNGFNQWDEEWEVGRISPSSGAPISSTANIRSKNFIPVFPNTNYVITNTSVATSWDLVAFDADKTYIKYLKWGGSQNKVTAFTTPENCYYVKFSTNDVTGGGGYGPTYKGDICINISWSGIHNGEYEAHWKSQRAIDVAQYFPDGMRGAGDAYDELTEDAAITRVGSIHIDAATNSTTSDGVVIGTVNLPNGIDNALPESVSCACDKLEPYQTTNALFAQRQNVVKVSRLSSSNTAMRAFILFDGTQTLDGINEKLREIGGIDLHYPITPITTPIDPPLNLTYRADDWGTERVMVDETQPAPQSAPPTMQVAYGVNAIDTLRNLPKDYVSAASDTNLCAALASALGLTITRTWDATKGEYDYAITQSGE